jgi:uncharacterized protein (DUF2141 family)
MVKIKFTSSLSSFPREDATFAFLSASALFRLTLGLTLGLVLGLVLGAQRSFAETLTINVQNAKPGAGNLMVGVYDDEENFTKKFYEGKKVEATGNEVAVVFPDLPKGRYAAAAYQDSNGNEKLDSNFFGIPAELYGLSNGEIKPDFGKCAFDFDSDMDITIKLR